MNLDFVKRVLSLEGKKAIVTGGNSGIGKAVAVSLAKMGADVAIIGRDRQTLTETIDELKLINANCTGESVDIRSKQEIGDYFDSYYRVNDNKLDILIANAGVCHYRRALDTTTEDLDYFFDINYKGTLYCCQNAAKAMKEQMSGNILIVTSVNALYPLPPQAAYSSTKGALEVLMQCLAVDLAPFNIRVNTLAPGAIRTNIGRNNPKGGPPAKPAPPAALAATTQAASTQAAQSEQQITQQPAPIRFSGTARPGLPLGRVGEPEDMGDAVACLVSDAFRYMTGSTILIDGGLKLRNV